MITMLGKLTSPEFMAHNYLPDEFSLRNLIYLISSLLCFFIRLILRKDNSWDTIWERLYSEGKTKDCLNISLIHRME